MTIRFFNSLIFHINFFLYFCYTVLSNIVKNTLGLSLYSSIAKFPLNRNLKLKGLTFKVSPFNLH